MFKFNNGNAKKRCEVCSKLTIKTSEQRRCRCKLWINFTPFSSGPSVNSEQVNAVWVFYLKLWGIICLKSLSGQLVGKVSYCWMKWICLTFLLNREGCRNSCADDTSEYWFIKSIRSQELSLQKLFVIWLFHRLCWNSYFFFYFLLLFFPPFMMHV